MAGVMIELRVIDPKHFAPGIRIGHIGVVNQDLPFGDHILVIEWVWIRDREISPLCRRLTRVSTKLMINGRRGNVEGRVKNQAKPAALVVLREI